VAGIDILAAARGRTANAAKMRVSMLGLGWDRGSSRRWLIFLLVLGMKIL
jgi:hypothetical protein